MDAPIYFPDQSVGAITRLVGANPAAGANFTYTIPTAENWLINSVCFQLLTNATVATRRPQFTAGLGATFSLFTTETTGQTASQTLQWAFMLGHLETATTDARVGKNLPYVLLTAGLTLYIQITAMQAGDQLSNIIIMYEKWRRA